MANTVRFTPIKPGWSKNTAPSNNYKMHQYSAHIEPLLLNALNYVVPIFHPMDYGRATQFWLVYQSLCN